MADVLKGLEIKNMTDVSADLYFYGDIVSDWWGAWQNEDQYPDAIKNFLSQAEGKDLNVYVNSGGGSVFAGMAIYNMIKRHGEKNKVKVYVDGLAGSIASVIAFAGTEPPEIPSNAFLMIHKPWGAISGNADEMRKMADDLDKIQTGIMNVYEEHLAEGVTDRSGGSVGKRRNMVRWQRSGKVFQYRTDRRGRLCGSSRRLFEPRRKVAGKIQITPETPGADTEGTYTGRTGESGSRRRKKKPDQKIMYRGNDERRIKRI